MVLLEEFYPHVATLDTSDDLHQFMTIADATFKPRNQLTRGLVRLLRTDRVTALVTPYSQCLVDHFDVRFRKRRFSDFAMVVEHLVLREELIYKRA
jgi:hypothetical protein